jgi:thioredoxin 1
MRLPAIHWCAGVSMIDNCIANIYFKALLIDNTRLLLQANQKIEIMAVQNVTDAEFNSILSSNTSVIVKFYADWCGACKLFAPKFKRISDEAENANVVFLDINAENNPEVRKLAGVSNLPFLAAFKNGELVEGSPGSKEEYLRKLIQMAQ